MLPYYRREGEKSIAMSQEPFPIPNVFYTLADSKPVSLHSRSLTPSEPERGQDRDDYS